MEKNKLSRNAMIVLLVIYHGAILFLLMAAMIPDDVTVAEFWENPLMNAQGIDGVTVFLAVALFVPLAYWMVYVKRYALMESIKSRKALMIGLFLLYEGIIVFLLIVAIIPQGLSVSEYLDDPIVYTRRVDQYTIALALALFLPLLYRKIDSLKIGSTEVRLRDEVAEVKNEIKEVKQSLSDQRFDYDRALFAIISRLNRQLEIGNIQGHKAAGKTVLRMGVLDFAESWITSEIVYQHMRERLEGVLDRHGNAIELKPPGVRESTLMTFFNLLSGKIDFFIWYSGTGMAMAGMELKVDKKEPYADQLNKVYKQWGLEWLESIGFENKEGPVMRKETADRHNIASMSQLTKHADKFIFGANREYFLRSWAYPRLKGMGIEFKGVKEVDINNRLSGLYNKDFDVGIIYDTDPEIKDYRLKKIEWEEPDFPPIHQHAMSICRSDHADIVQDALDGLKIEAEEMIKMKKKAKRRQYDDEAIKGIAGGFFR